VTPAPPPFQTRAEFQRAHEALLDLVDGPGDDVAEDASGGVVEHIAEWIGQVREFLAAGAAGGAYLHEPKERLGCQRMLDFWAGRCYAAGQDVSRPLLAPYDPSLLPSLSDESCPYLGLDSFSETSAARFFGRDDDIATLLQKVAGQSLTVVTGWSGSGKSSLVLAGLLPALRRGAVDGSDGWLYMPVLVPGIAPLRHLADALRRAIAQADADPVAWAGVHAAQMLADPGHAAQLLDATGRRAVVVVDQFEEAVTLPSPQTAAQYRAFVANLLAIASASRLEHRVVLTMRKDVEPSVARDYPALNARYLTSEFAVHAMDSSRLREAIEKPAALAGLKFQAGLVDDLVKRIVGEESGLPLLQFSLMALWERRRGNLVMNEDYREIGGPQRAMALAADDLFRAMSVEQQVATEAIFMELARQGEDASVFRNRVSRGSLYQLAEAPNVDAVLDAFEGARLLRVTRVDPHERRNDVAEVAHESLLRNWDRLVSWLAARRNERERRAFLRNQAERWRGAKYDEAFLLSGLALEQACVEIEGGAVTALEREFLESGEAAERRRMEAEAQQRNAEHVQAMELERGRRRIAEAQALAAKALAQRVRRGTLIAAVIGAGVVAATVSWGHRQRVEVLSYVAKARAQSDKTLESARQQLATAVARQTIAEQHAVDAENKVEAARAKAQEIQREAERALEKANSKAAAARAELLLGEERGLEQLARFNVDTDADLSILAAAEAVHRDPHAVVRMMPLVVAADRFRRASSRLPAEQVGEVDALALDRSGRRLAVAGVDGIMEWALSTGGWSRARARPLPWDTVDPAPRYLAYTPDGRSIAAATRRGVVIWSVDGTSEARLFTSQEPCQRVYFSPDGRLVSAIHVDSRHVDVWAVDSGRLLLSHDYPSSGTGNANGEDDDSVFAAFFSPAGDSLIVLETPKGRDVQVRRFEHSIKDGVVEAEPRVIATTPCAGEPPFTFAAGAGHFAVSINPQFCLVNYRQRPGLPDASHRVMDGATDAVSDFLFDADGRYVVALIGNRREARVLDLETNAQLVLQGAFDLEARSYEEFVSISAPEGRLAIRARDGSIRVYDLSVSPDGPRSVERPFWVDPQARVAIQKAGTPSQPTYEARDFPTGTILTSLDLDGKKLDGAAPFSLGPDGRWLIARTAPDRDASGRVLLAFDLANGGRRSELSVDAILKQAGDLSVVRVGDATEVHLAARPEAAFVLRSLEAGSVAASEPASERAKPTILLPTARVFAVARQAQGRLHVDVYRIDNAGVPSLALGIDREVPGGAVVAMTQDGALLLVNRPGGLAAWRVDAPSVEPALELEGEAISVFCDAATGILLTRKAGRPWEVRDLARPELVKRTLADNASVSGGGDYEWFRLPGGGIQIRDIAQTWRAPVTIPGKDVDLYFSNRGGTVAALLRHEGRQRIYRLPRATPVVDVDALQFPITGFIGDGRYIRLADGRYVALEAEHFIADARHRVAREFDDDERCRTLFDHAACERLGAPKARPVASNAQRP